MQSDYTTSQDTISRESETTMRISGKLQGLGCVVMVLLIMFVCFFGMPMFFGIIVEQTRTAPGDAAHFDPIATFNEVANYAGDGAEIKFVSLSARYVHSDGTLNLNESYYPGVDYEFYRVVKPQQSDVPVGAPGYVSRDATYQEVEVRIWQPYQMRSVSRGGSEYQYIHLGMARDIDETLDVSMPSAPASPPTCSFVDLWNQAIDKGAPDDGVAIINYDITGYTFSIQETNYRYHFTQDCAIKP